VFAWRKATREQDLALGAGAVFPSVVFEEQRTQPASPFEALLKTESATPAHFCVLILSLKGFMSKTERLDNLDLLRGVAAFLVLASHLRAYIFQSFGELAHTDVLTRAFYFTTGLGHQAVIIFFALSGFLVGGKAFQDILDRRFSWSRYLLRRLTRLWIVIIPALLLTLIFDSIGSWLSHGIGYDGSFRGIYSQGPLAPRGADDSLLAFVGNLLFLQTIYVPTFGSNGPMWSLANEFWYYIVFPLAAWVSLSRVTAVARVAGLGVLSLTVTILPLWLLESGAIWVAGAAAAYCARQPVLSHFLRHIATRVSAFAVLFAALVLSKTRAADVGDLELGLAVAIALPVLATLRSPGGIYRVLARAGSELSYTLYLTHFPLLTFIFMVTFAPNRFSPTIYSAVLYVSLISLAMAWAALVWWFFERNTDRVFAWINGTWLAPATGEGKLDQIQPNTSTPPLCNRGAISLKAVGTSPDN
jgi:peptidoglycan/LPS O-acetylase OafA/YrhL